MVSVVLGSERLFVLLQSVINCYLQCSNTIPLNRSGSVSATNGGSNSNNNSDNTSSYNTKTLNKTPEQLKQDLLQQKKQIDAQIVQMSAKRQQAVDKGDIAVSQQLKTDLEKLAGMWVAGRSLCTKYMRPNIVILCTVF